MEKNEIEENQSRFSIDNLEEIQKSEFIFF